MEFYWELVQFDGTRIEVPPAAVEVIKRRWDAGQPIHTARQGSIPHNQIKHFRPTDKVFTAQPLLEAAAQAFNEPVVESEAIMCRWVKKRVTQQNWGRYYSHHPYKKLGEEGGMVLVGFRLPIHQINAVNTPYCTDDEVRELTTRQ